MTLFARATKRSTAHEHRRGRRLLGAIVGVTALGGLIASFSAEAASASAPASATFSPGSSAASTTSTWTVGFTTSSSGALAPSNTISVVFNPSFVLATGQSVIFSGFGASCPAANDFVNGNVATVTLSAGCALADSTAASLSIPGITNPVAGTYPNSTFSVATSQDSSAVSTASNIVIGAASSSASATAVSVNPNPVPPVGQVTLAATVTPSSATGSVTFFNNGSPISGCTAVALASAAASCVTSYTSIGNTAYVVVYSGSSSLTGSTSATLTPTAQVETRTSIELRKGSDPYGLESRQRISVQVSTVLGTPAAITGTVKVMAGSQLLCTITLASNGGSCTLSARQLKGNHTYRIYGVYAGSTNYATSTSDNQLYRIIG
jgi:Bacterial Ig-like domain (group 3)